MADVPLRIMLSVVGGNALSGALGQIASSLGPAGIVGAALVGFGVTSVKAAATFQNAMLQNESHAGLAASQVQNVNQALLAMGPAVGQGPTQLAEALYPILSGFSGISNQAAKTQVSLTELKLASESVAGSTTSVTTVSNAATAAFNALGLQTNNTALATQRMQHLFDVMNTTVSSGNMHWQDYANVAGKLATSIKGTTVSFNEANAALATMTNEGFSAQLSSHYLSNLFTQLDLKTDSMAKHAAKLGIAFDEQRFKTMSLAQQMDYLKKITNGNQSELLALLGGNATALKTYNALESGMNSYKGNLDALNHSQGATAAAFQVASSGFNFSLQRLSASFQSLQISVGNIFLPLLTDIVNAIVPVVAGLATWLATNNQITESITNASTGLQPALRHARDMAMDLSQVLSYWLMHALTPLDAQFKITAQTVQTRFLPSLQQTSSWMQSTGEPVYASFAKVVRDVLSGSFQKAQQDAISMGMTITQTLQGLPAKFQSINLPKLNIGTGGLMLLFAPLFLLQTKLQPVLSWLQSTFGPTFQAIFTNVLGPPIQAFQQIVQDLQPDFLQFAIFWETQIIPLFSGNKLQSSGSPLQQLGQIWKDLWQAIVPVVEIIVRLALWITEGLLPPIIKVGGFLFWLSSLLIGPIMSGIDMALQGFAQFANWINQNVLPIFEVFIVEYIPQFIDWLQSLGTQLWGVAQSIGSSFQQGAQNAIQWLQSILQWFQDFPSNAMSFVESFAAKMVLRMQNLWRQIMDDAKSLLGGSGIASVFKSAINLLIAQINNFIASLDRINVSVPGIGSVGFSIPQIPYLYAGGYITTGGLAVVGDRGPELLSLPTGASVTPLSGGGAGPSYYITINLATMARSQSEVHNLVDLIEQELGRRVRSQTASWASGGIF